MRKTKKSYKIQLCNKLPKISIVPSQDQCTIEKLTLEVPEDLTPTEER